MTTSTRNRTLNTRLAEMDAAASERQAWETALADAQAAADAAGAARPTTPQDATALAQRRVTTREQARMAAECLNEAQKAEVIARRAVLLAEAELLTPEIEKRQKAIDAHRAQTEALLGPLRDHTGQTWIAPAMTEGEIPLHEELARLRFRQQVLRDAGDGREPDALDESGNLRKDLPDAVLVGGVLPCRAAVAQAERQTALEAERAAQQALQDELDAAVDVLGRELVTVALSGNASVAAEYQRPDGAAVAAFDDEVLHHRIYPNGDTRVVPQVELNGITEEQRQALLVVTRLATQFEAYRVVKRLRGV